MKKWLLIAPCLLLVASGSAWAFPCVWDDCYETVVTGPFPVGVPTPISFQGFDPSLGTFRGAYIQTSVWLQVDALFLNPSPDPWQASARVRYISSSYGSGWSQMVVDYFNVAPESDVPPGGSQLVHLTVQATNDIYYAAYPYYSPAFLTAGRVPAVVGWGFFDVLYSHPTYPEITGQVDRIVLQVHYEYEPDGHAIPEPASAMLLGLGATGLLLKHRRTRRA